MKIDLHIHTKKTAKGDPVSREVDKLRFNQIMKDSDIGIAAITNHYIFDKKQYSEFVDPSSFILLPGVELDISINDKKVQANVIAHPEDIEKFTEILARIDNKHNILEYADFLKEFNIDRWIVYLDCKNSKNTSWDQINLEKAIKDFDNAIVIADTNRSTTLMVLNSHNFNALIGSDNLDWDNYFKNSNKLVSTKLNIKNYDAFLRILKYKSSDMNELFKNINVKKIESIKMPETDYSVTGIELMQGVNVIFGAKRTGKSEILKSLKQTLDNKQTYYSSSEKTHTMDKMKSNIMNIDLFEEKKDEYWKNIKQILEYKETKFNDFHNFYLSMKESTKISFQNNISDLLNDPAKSGENSEHITNISLFKKSLDTSIMHMNKIDVDHKHWDRANSKMINEIKSLYKKYYSEYWKGMFDTAIKNYIDKLMKKNKGIVPKPSNIGLYKRYTEKLEIQNCFNKLKKNGFKFSKTLKKFEIPGRSKVEATQVINFIDLHGASNFDKFKNIKIKTENIAGKLKKMSFSSDFNEISKKIGSLGNKVENFFSEYVIIKDEKGNTIFSNGEQAHLLLHETLNVDKEYYLLDEPGVFLSRESITDFLLNKISELSRNGKTVVIATHNSSLGINTIPINYIFRKYAHGDECQTYQGNIFSKVFTNIGNNENTLNFIEEIIGAFEGSEKHFKFRKDMYENKI